MQGRHFEFVEVMFHFILVWVPFHYFHAYRSHFSYRKLQGNSRNDVVMKL